MRKFRWALLGFLLNLIASPGFSASGAPTAGREVTVAAAADLNSVLTEIAASFKKQTGITVKLSFGSSGALAQQIQNGAPFDLFFSADMDYPRQLADAGQAEASSLYRYAVGGLALWVSADSPLARMSRSRPRCWRRSATNLVAMPWRGSRPRQRSRESRS